MRLDIRQGHKEKPEDLTQFQWTVRAAFGQRRKTLTREMPFGQQSRIPDECLSQVQQGTGIALSRRAEALSVEEFRHLSQALPPFLNFLCSLNSPFPY